jgi:hypothetical protein
MGAAAFGLAPEAIAAALQQQGAWVTESAIPVLTSHVALDEDDNDEEEGEANLELVYEVCFDAELGRLAAILLGKSRAPWPRVHSL